MANSNSNGNNTEVSQPRKISDEEINYLFSLKSDNINKELIWTLFAYRKNSNPKFQPSDYFVLPKDKLYNKEPETTTVGRYIFNLLILTDPLNKYIEYINTPMEDKAIGKLDSKIAKLLLEEKISINASLSVDFIITNDEIKEKKNELAETYKKEINEGDINTAVNIEKELIGMAKDIYKDHPSMQIYDSGCRGSFGNNYKNSSIMRKTLRFISVMIYLNFSNCWNSLKLN
jgi:hypothetical protein